MEQKEGYINIAIFIFYKSKFKLKNLNMWL